MKLIVGLTTGSLGILSEAAHSALDLVAAGVTWFAVNVSSKPADREHTYGHGKIENLSALFETLLLLATCGWIIHEATHRLFLKTVEVEATPWAFIIMSVSIIVDFSRSRALSRVAKKYSSQALEADALHFSTDIYSSLVVMAGLVAVYLSDITGYEWLHKADALAALGVALIVIWISYHLGRKTIADLLDEIPPGVRDAVVNALDIPGVVSVERVRIRRSGPENFVDATLIINRQTSLSQGHEIANQAEQSIRRIIPGADVIIHIEPLQSDDQPGLRQLHTTIREIAASLSIGAHAIHIHDVMGRFTVETHLEVDDSLTVAEAHEQATRFEHLLHERLPIIDHVITHIETDQPPDEVNLTTQIQVSDVSSVLETFIAGQSIPCRPHDIEVIQTGNDVAATMHCAVDGKRGISEVHAFTEQIERELKNNIPGLHRVIIHVEPSDEPDPKPHST